MKNNRIESIDVLRGITIILVVLGHVIEKTDAGKSSSLYNFIYSFHMPLFMAISGFVAKFSYRLNSEFNKAHLLYVYNKFRGIMVPYFVWGLIIRPLFFYDLQNEIDYSLILTSVFVSNTSYWFLPCLFGLIIIFSIYMGIQRIIPKKNWIIDLLIILVLMVGISGLYYFTGNDFLRSIQSYFIPFFIGAYAASNEKFKNIVFSNAYVYAIALIAFCLMVGFFDATTGALNKLIRLVIGIVSLPVCFYFVEKVKIPNIIKNQIIFIGQNTLIIYLMHFYFRNSIIDLPTLNGSNFFLLIYSIIIIYICIALSKFLNINPILKLFLLGKKK